MLQYKKTIGFLACFIMLLLIGCYKNVSVISTTGEEITRPVSFTADIIPIFNSSCSLSGCHTTGGKSPDLTAANAYNSLMNGGYVNTADPESSVIYLWMTGKKSTPMPPSGINKDYNSLMLAWIKQGAKNN
ncbi:hypothetical protein [Flavihumibacter profundi]|jgi:hypothetical protein|uniref:hypothetical protein n=1 Tax=Flavihumibacter profundi TaxID=2716883 RepID=UPI001CC382BC|nr:hypothetical protein [Flavihumibacter profundi]MBZ5857223.1 hypothetical protein [Flavihumibacter profundi]